MTNDNAACSSLFITLPRTRAHCRPASSQSYSARARSYGSRQPPGGFLDLRLIRLARHLGGVSAGGTAAAWGVAAGGVWFAGRLPVVLLVQPGIDGQTSRHVNRRAELSLLVGNGGLAGIDRPPCPIHTVLHRVHGSCGRLPACGLRGDSALWGKDGENDLASGGRKPPDEPLTSEQMFGNQEAYVPRSPS